MLSGPMHDPLGHNRLNQDSQLLREELRIKDARMAKVDLRHTAPTE